MVRLNLTSPFKGRRKHFYMTFLCQTLEFFAVSVKHYALDMLHIYFAIPALLVK
uniref:Uncharacterized protein n=1 Tax=Anguilla anguilla TaxID=7936 RepID=A0A0E9PKB0_ANGAN